MQARLHRRADRSPVVEGRTAQRALASSCRQALREMIREIVLEQHRVARPRFARAQATASSRVSTSLIRGGRSTSPATLDERGPIRPADDDDVGHDAGGALGEGRVLGALGPSELDHSGRDEHSPAGRRLARRARSSATPGAGRVGVEGVVEHDVAGLGRCSAAAGSARWAGSTSRFTTTSGEMPSSSATAAAHAAFDRIGGGRPGRRAWPHRPTVRRLEARGRPRARARRRPRRPRSPRPAPPSGVASSRRASPSRRSSSTLSTTTRAPAVISAFAESVRSRVPKRSRCDGPIAVMTDDLGLEPAAQRGDLARPVGAHLGHEHLGPRRRDAR